MASYVTINKWNGDRLADGPVPEGETWQEVAIRLYNTATHQHGLRIGLDEHFPGGGTHHVQFGRKVQGGNAMSLDSTVIVHVDD